MKRSFLYIGLLISFPVQSQFSIQNDTIEIKEVIISRKQISSELPGFKITSIDTAVLKNYSLFSLAEVLNETSPLFIKSYGSGGSSTPSFRGTPAGHTLIMWNGININNPMLGQSDFSLVPAAMVDNVTISFGGASMDIGDGAPGGIINLENEPLWTKQTVAELNTGAGSFGRYSGLIKLKTGTEYFQTVTKAYLNSSQNDFPYLNTKPGNEPAWEKRNNSKVLQKGLMQEFYLRRSENVLSLRFWYQSASRSLPGSTLYGNAGENQSDESLRSLLNYDFVKGKSEYFLTGAWMFTKLNYLSQLYSIDSRNKANTLTLKGGMTTRIGDFTKLKLVISNELNKIETNNYAEGVERNNAYLTLSAERKKGDRFGTVFLVRETIDGNTFLIPDFSAGFEFRLISGEDHFLKYNVSRNSKIPSLNDRYWNPGGNPDLKNEYAYSYELGYKLDHKISPAIKIGSEISFFSNYIRDMIQWHPGESLYWVADNIASVNTSGIEISASGKYVVEDVIMSFNAGYSYTRAIAREPESSVDQLIYVPKNQANGSVHIGFKNFYAIWITRFTGIRYTTADNFGYLPGYTVNNFTGGMKIKLKDNLFDINLKIENLFDVSYQAIEYYPQPGRSFYLTLLYQFKR